MEAFRAQLNAMLAKYPLDKVLTLLFLAAVSDTQSVNFSTEATNQGFASADITAFGTAVSTYLTALSDLP